MFIPLRDNIPKLGTPVLTIALIVINCLVFVMFEGSDKQAMHTIAGYGAVPHEIVHPDQKCMPRSETDDTPVCESRAKAEAEYGGYLPPAWMTLFSSMFLHAGILHLVGNMLFLFVFGWALEGALGIPRFLGLYLLSGIAADFGQILYNTGEQFPGIGASGAIAGVMGAYLVLFPRAKMMSLLLFVFPCDVRAIWVLLTWLFEQAVILKEMQISGAAGGVAVFAHLGGFAMGALLVYILLSREQIEEQRQIADWATRQDELAEESPQLASPSAPMFVSGSYVPAAPQFYNSHGVAVSVPPGYVAPAPPGPPPRDPFAPPQL
ncbi:MAG: rhomboid family intramembrane serine protease [Solirubrobacterales bacterium]